MSDYKMQLEEERRIVAKLRKELSLHEAMVRALEGLAGCPPSGVGSEPFAQERARDNATEPKIGRDVPNRMTQLSIDILWELDGDGKNLSEVESFCRSKGSDIARSTLASRLGFWKRSYGFIESPEEGVYRMTEKARRYLMDKYPERATKNAAETNDKTIKENRDEGLISEQN